MKKNKFTNNQWMKAGIKNKSKPGKKLDLGKLDLSKDPGEVDVTLNAEKPKKKEKEKEEKKKKRKAFWSDADSLWSCDTVNKVEAWLLTGNSTFQELALKSAARKKLPPDLWGALEALVTAKGATSEPILLDPGIQLSAFHQLHESFEAVSRVRDDIEFALVTIIDGQFETSNHHTLLDIYNMKGSSRRILSRMSSNYFAHVDLALFNSHKHPRGGRLISPHVHAIIWGNDVVSKAFAIAKTLQVTIKPNATGATPIDVKSVGKDSVNLARMAAYLLKSPEKCKTFYPGKDGVAGNMHHSRKSDRLIRYLRLAEIRSMLTFKDMTFASGEGLAVRSGIAKTLTQFSQEQARKADRRFHPAEIPSFWNELKLTMGTTRFNLPIIKRTK